MREVSVITSTYFVLIGYRHCSELGRIVVLLAVCCDDVSEFIMNGRIVLNMCILMGLFTLRSSSCNANEPQQLLHQYRRSPERHYHSGTGVDR